MNTLNEHIQSTFTVHAYGRAELAMLYFPSISPMAAWRHLKQSIRTYPHLTERLAALGYNPRQRTFTPRQVEAIVEAIGEP